MKILIADDAIFIRTILKSMINRHFEAEIIDFDNGRKLVDAFTKLHIENEKVDLILCDLTMPEMDGLTALTEIRKIDPITPFILCAGFSSNSTIVNAIKLGATHFISKPFIAENVIERIKNILIKVCYDDNGFVSNPDPFVFFHFIKINNLQMVKTFIESGIDINVYIYGKSTLDIAIQNGDSEMILCLYELYDKFDSYNQKLLRLSRLAAITSSTINR